LQVTIDPNSGFCFGVVHAIAAAERELSIHHQLYCLGNIVHNSMEVDRLKKKGLVIISHEEFLNLHDCRVLIRAHGEPPETYKTALQNHVELIDASCPIVLRLQGSIHKGYLEMNEKNGQIVIYGQEGHAEVNALNGQANGNAIVIGNESDLTRIDFSRPVRLFSQTTKSVDGFQHIVQMITLKMERFANGFPIDFEWSDSICRQVSNRSVQLVEFVSGFDVVVFVSGQQSSNGMVLYQVCKGANPRTYFVSNPGELKSEWFANMKSAGICGATSTPLWLMEAVAATIQNLHE
jgi:4-hydroxy-3-methylbut-2-enyl diphosphate reductase